MGLSINLSLPTWREVSGRLIGVGAADKMALLDWIGGAMMGAGGWQPNTPFLRVAMPCGSIKEWWTIGGVPDQSVRCYCGNVDYEHWFIYYERETDGEVR